MSEDITDRTKGEEEGAAEDAPGFEPEPAEAPGAAEDALPEDELGAPESAALAEELEAAKDQLLRARADFDNYRKRMAREAERIRKTAAEKLLRDLLPVVDNLERAIDHAENPEDSFVKGVDMVLRQMRDVLTQHGVTLIPAVGEPFDPNLHEAMTRMHVADVPEDAVAAEFQRGYRLGDFVLRPSKVAVSAGPPEPVDGGTREEHEQQEDA